MRKIIKTFIILLIQSIPHSYGQELNKVQIQQIANNLLLSDKFRVKIKKVLPSQNGIQVVLLDIPYREYPSIIIITENKTTKKWDRTFECLSPGIQDKTSALLDWHTTGEGVDFTIDSIKRYDFNNSKVRAMAESSIKMKGGVIIPYQQFIHMNTGSDHGPSAFVPYTMDKTQYFDFANLLFNNRYKDYPTTECMMFDTPAINDCTFEVRNNLYVITATTGNNQIWTYTFTGIDSKQRYLLNKKITVQNF